MRDNRIPLIRAENVKINIGGDVKVSFHSSRDPSSFVNPKFSSSSFRRQDPESTFATSSFNIPRSEGTRTKIVRRIINN